MRKKETSPYSWNKLNLLSSWQHLISGTKKNPIFSCTILCLIFWIWKYVSFARSILRSCLCNNHGNYRENFDDFLSIFRIWRAKFANWDFSSAKIEILCYTQRSFWEILCRGRKGWSCKIISFSNMPSLVREGKKFQIKIRKKSKSRDEDWYTQKGA